MLITALLALSLSNSTPLGACEPAASQDLVPRQYLTITPVDRRGRRPFQPDAIYRDHIWKPGSAPPVVGESERGELGSEQAWGAQEANERGQLEGSLGYAYTSFDLPQREVRLAQLAGAWTLYVNGRAYFGDAYRFGFGGVPVVLEAGTNHVYVTGIRGGFGLVFAVAEPGLLRGGWDDTLPHQVIGEAPRGAVGIELSNLSLYDSGPLTIEYGGGAFERCEVHYPEGLRALGANQFSLPLSGAVVETEGVLPLAVRARAAGYELEFSLELQVRQPGERRRCTYISGVDGAALEYALVPPSAPPSRSAGEGASEAWMGLALSLHGASVGSWGQANCYSQRPDFWVAAAMNRRPYGFDWQDWGRRDAYDVLQLALEESGVDPRFKFVTGHSMGGHGTWHLAANDLDGFAACGPSAGWESFDSYGGRPAGALSDVWHAADGASRTLDLIGNLKQLPTYIIHGTADDNVPASEALTMIDALTEAGGSFDVHFEGGAGHWWGNACVDWPPLFDFFRKQALPVDPARVDFRSVGPHVDAEHHWLRVEQVHEQGQQLRIHGEYQAQARRVELHTENVAFFRVSRELDLAVIDEQELELDVTCYHHWFRHDGERWSYVQRRALADHKRAERMGPLKNAYDREFLMVVGTTGSADEDAATLANAQLQAGSWRYRANGAARILTDVEYLERVQPATHNVILFGNRDTNAAWAAVVDERCPIDVYRDRVEWRRAEQTTTHQGDDLGCAFVYRQAASEEHLVGVFAFTGLPGARLGSNLQPFKSGAGYPDFTLYNSEILTSGDGGVIEAGWFDNEWRLPPSK